jgi:hypothetical protein
MIYLISDTAVGKTQSETMAKLMEQSGFKRATLKEYNARKKQVGIGRTPKAVRVKAKFEITTEAE